MSAIANKHAAPLATLVDAVRRADWEHVDADTRYLTHNIHRYSGKYIPQIARTVIQLLSQPGDLIVDPYAGSGTTVLEAGLVGRQAFGVDLNPLGVLIAKAKTTNIGQERLDEMVMSLSAVAAATSGGAGSDTLPGLSAPTECVDAVDNDPRLHDEWFTKWFELPILRDLLLIDAAVNTLPHPEQRSLGSVALSNILRKSSRAHGGYPNVMFDRNARPRPRPGRAFLVSLQRCSSMVSALPPLSGLELQIGDARRLPLRDETAHAIVTHPPYIGSVPYAEYGLISLKWFGHDPKELDATLTGGRRQSRDVIERFAEGYAAAFHDWFRVLKPACGMFVMVGQPVVRGCVVNLPEMSLRYASEAGFVLEAETGRTGTNRRANKMGSEALMFFRKP